MSAIGMPSHLMAYFVPRPPLEKIAPPPKKVYKPYEGLAALISGFETTEPPPVEPFEAPKERRERLKQEKANEHQSELKVKISQYDPHKDDEKVKTINPHKTLFVGRLSHETTQKKLLKIFEEYGPVTDIRLVTDKESKPRGYAFIEYKTTEGLRTAFREANNKVIDGRKIVVDIEKARTHENWLPRRLGGGEGPPRCGISKKVLQMRALERRHTGPPMGGGGLGGSGHMGGTRGGLGRGMSDGGDRHGNRNRGGPSWGGGDRMRRDNNNNFGRGGNRSGNWDSSGRGGGGAGRGHDGRSSHGNMGHAGTHEAGGGGRGYGGTRDGTTGVSAPYRHNNSNNYHNDDRHNDNTSNRREDRHTGSNRSDPYGSTSGGGPPRRNNTYNNSSNNFGNMNG